MTSLTTYKRWYGRDEPPPETIALRAGALALDYQAGDLRYIRWGSQELIRRIYVAVRDVNWNTIPGQISQLHIDAADNHFHISYQAVHTAGPLKFRWIATITGNEAGHIRFLMDGLTESDFRYCRIGFCVLHPVAGIAGSVYQAQTPEGPVKGMLPKLVAPQLIRDGFELPLFPACSQFVVETPTGIRIRTDFEGDLFEAEDQRNWTDGSFKTYCTPLALGYPHQATAGQVIRQEVIISATNPAEPAAIVPQDHLLALSLATSPVGILPRLGFGLTLDANTTGRQNDLLAALRPAHLKTELHLGDPQWRMRLEGAIRAAEQVDSELELAIFLVDGSDAALDVLRSHLQSVPVARIIVFHEAEAAGATTSPRYVQLVRERLADVLPGVPCVGGTNGNFAELNRQRPDASSMDGFVFTINPQVHASDELSLIEAIEAQRDVIVTARSFSNALPIIVSSVTLKPPFNQAATEAEAPPDPHELPSNVDPRQMALFAAAWTVGSIGALAEGGAESVTYYETLGWRGLMETAQGSPLPALFSSAPGMVFPVYWVFRFLAGADRSPIRPLLTDQPLRVVGFSFQVGEHLGLLLANLQPTTQDITVAGLPNGVAHLRRLNENTMPQAGAEPQAFYDMAIPLTIRNETGTVALLPYETLFAQFLSS